MKKALLITTAYLPQKYPGSIRLAKAAKYLPEFGWEPVIFTIAPHPIFNQRVPEFEMDDGGPRIIRTRCIDLRETPVNLINRLWRGGRGAGAAARVAHGSGGPGIAARLRGLAGKAYHDIMGFPDFQWPWYFSAGRGAVRAARKEGVDAVFSTSPPPVSHLVASLVKRRTGVRWVAEFRDLWTMNHYYRRCPGLYSIERALERRTLSSADEVITVSPVLAEREGDLLGRRVRVVPNGFDEEDYSAASAPRSGFRIVYTGGMYPDKYDPTPVFGAVARLAREGRIRAGEFSIEFYGRNVYLAEPYARACGVEEFVRIHGEIPLEEVIPIQKSATLLLLLAWLHPSERGDYTSKIFEYLGASRPVLAVCLPDSVVAELLDGTGAGFAVQDEEGAYAVLSRYLDEYEGGGVTFAGKREKILRFTRRGMARDIAECLGGSEAS